LYSGRADWSAIARLKEAVTEVPVLGNGDIWDPADALAMMRETGCDGVVVGRGCLGKPWLFRDLDDAFAWASRGCSGTWTMRSLAGRSSRRRCSAPSSR
jgi:tRNA-dihydrouridine synthase